MHLGTCQSENQCWKFSRLTSMTDASVVDLDSDFMGFGRRNFDILNGQVLSCFPGHCGLNTISMADPDAVSWEIDLTLQVMV